MHQPFFVLGDLVKQGRLRLSRAEHKTNSKDARYELVSPVSELSDGGLFEKEVGEVRRIADNILPKLNPTLLQIKPSDDEGDVIKVLEEFCRSGEVDAELRREYVEHASGLVGRLHLKNLRKGHFAIQAHLDLHGLTVERARTAVDDFIGECVRRGHSCVRIVHGRGVHSPRKHSQLKKNVQRWLRSRRFGRHVIAYSSARLVDGGGGAVYVLLRCAR